MQLLKCKWRDIIVFFRGIYRLSRRSHNVTGIELIGEAVFARITDLKYIEKIGNICLSYLTDFQIPLPVPKFRFFLLFVADRP